MKKAFLVVATALLCASAFAFGPREHAAIAIIAENHLTPKAKAQIMKITGGQHLVQYASFPDKFRPYYLHEGNRIPHTLHLDANFQPDTDVKTSVLGSVALAYDGLMRRNTTEHPDSTVTYLAYMVHFVGDMHCPSHQTFDPATSIKAPKYYVIDGEKINWHSAWDKGFSAFAFYGGPMDLAFLADVATPKQIKEYQKGSVMDWALENAKVVYNYTRDVEFGEDGTAIVTNMYSQQHAEYAKTQIMKAGYRLAAMLNKIFK